MTAVDNILTTNNLTVGYGSKPVLSNIDISLCAGQLTCFMGPNGSGKSTLLRTLGGFQNPLSGSIQSAYGAMHALTTKQRSRLFSFVLTDRLPSDYMTGRELVASGRMPYTGWMGKLSPNDEDIIENALQKTMTEDIADQWLYRMSDGQRQKLMIARALCQDTPVIILDEPTAHLDLNNRVAIVNLLRDLAHKEGRAILMATHELDLALQLADRLWLSETKKSISTGIPEDLVLNGTLDRVFKFKGFDLKTGQVEIIPSGRKISLSGEGHQFLWTKNALERNGYTLSDDSPYVIKLVTGGKETHWNFQSTNYATLESLLGELNNVPWDPVGKKTNR